MHPRLAPLVDYVVSQRRVLLGRVDDVPEFRRDARMSLESWSVAEVLGHLHRGQHESRHAEQIAEIGRELGSK